MQKFLDYFLLRDVIDVEKYWQERPAGRMNEGKVLTNVIAKAHTAMLPEALQSQPPVAPFAGNFQIKSVLDIFFRHNEYFRQSEWLAHFRNRLVLHKNIAQKSFFRLYNNA